jgi:hypothetical protein
VAEEGKTGGGKLQFGFDALAGPLSYFTGDEVGKEVGEQEQERQQASCGDAGDLEDPEDYPRKGRSHASKVLPFPGEIPAEYFILLKNSLIFIIHYAADDHLICDLLPADHFLQQAFGHESDISLLY